MKVLVTGACGFLGSHVCEFYKCLGEEVVGIDNLTKYEMKHLDYNSDIARTYNWKYITKLGVEFHLGDILVDKDLKAVSKDVDYIVNCAAQPTMTLSIKDPFTDLSVNVLGGVKILELARKLDIPVLMCSTIHVYGTEINKYLEEEDTRFTIGGDMWGIPEYWSITTGKLTPLHASKRAMELYCRVYNETYGVKVGCFRLTGFYGPRQFGGEDHGWVANFAIRLLTGRTIKIFGTDKQVRDILYVSDVVNAVDKFWRVQKPDIYNVGGGEKTAISLRECINLLSDITGIQPKLEYLPPRHGDLWYFVSNIRKARYNLRWEPHVPPEEGLEYLVHWIQNNMEIFK